MLSLCAAAQTQPGPVVMGESVKLQSSVLKESRDLLIAKPAGYNEGNDRYPVLYLLDAELHFHYLSGIAAFLARNDRMPRMLVVGIVSGDTARRTRDLTPPTTVESENRFSPGNGGAENFLAFLGNEVVPFIEKTYRTRPYRLLAGHSFGGLFAAYALGMRPGLFNGYIAADPSLFWNEQSMVRRAEALMPRLASVRADFYLATSGSKIPPAALRFTEMLDKSSAPSLRWYFDQLPAEDHASIPVPAFSRGLEKIFEEWRLPDPLVLYDRGGMGAIHERHREAGRRFGYPERTTPPFTVSMLAAGLILAGRLDDAGTVLLHDTAAYPPPWNQLDALARAYEKQREAGKAARYYGLSLERNPANSYARKKLAELGGKE
jgi:predicted alpha/beta superfamily hydrolase